MKKTLYLRLSAMMFLFYVAAGAIIPIMSLYMHSVLGFTGMQIGMILSLSMLSALASPLLGAFIADRVLPAESVLGITQIAAGVCMFLIAFQDRFVPFFMLFAVYELLFGPGVALTNTVFFHHTPDARRQFGGVRLWGTAGWVAAGWFFSLFWLGTGKGVLGDALFFSGGTSVALGLFALTLAPGGGLPPRRRELVPRAALRLMLKPQLYMVVLAAVVVQFVDKYYYFGAAPYLDSLGFAEVAIMPAMSIGQISEIISMLFLGMFLARLGFRKVMLLGIVMELGRFSCFLFGTSKASALIGLIFHGPAFAFFFAAAFIYVDSFADTESRAGVQQLFNLVTIGIGNFLGSIIAGLVFEGAILSRTGEAPGMAGTVGRAAETFSLSSGADFRIFWAVPLVMVILLLMVLASGWFAGRRK